MLRGEAGLAGKVLVGVVAWALGAVLLLTATLVNAQQIDNRVDRITHTVGPIDHDLDSVELAKKTSETVNSIDGNVGSIGGAVRGIAASLDAVLGTARGIRGDHAVTDGFGTGIAGINRRADAAIAFVQLIKGDSGNILASVKKIEASAKSIENNADKLP